MNGAASRLRPLSSVKTKRKSKSNCNTKSNGDGRSVRPTFTFRRFADADGSNTTKDTRTQTRTPFVLEQAVQTCGKALPFWRSLGNAIARRIRGTKRLSRTPGAVGCAAFFCSLDSQGRNQSQAAQDSDEERVGIGRSHQGGLSFFSRPGFGRSRT